MHFVLSMTFFLVVYVGHSHAVYKRWLKNTDFENPMNWNVQPPRAPCGNDRVIVPDDSPVIYLQMNTSLQELTLPKNGEIILGNNVQLSFTSESSPDCPSAGGDVEFTAVHPSSWFNPDNWCITNTELSDCLPNSIIDTENVPCDNDDVVFLRHRSYYVTLGQGLDLTMKTLKILGTSFTTSSFAQFLSSADGRKMFKPALSGTATSVAITRQSCSVVGGCACRINDQVQQQICAIKSKTCTRSPCKNPVTPLGACCDMCGVVLNGTRGRGFHLNDFRSKLQASFFNSYPNVSTAVSITATGDVQLVLTDDGDGKDSARLANLILADINADLKDGGHKYALDAISQIAGSAGTSAHTGENTASSSKLQTGAIAGIAVGIVVLLVIIIIIVLLVRRGRPNMSNLPSWPDWSNFSRNFSRFSNKREPPSGSATPPRTVGPLDPGFNNPLYDNPPFDDGCAREMELRSPMEEQPTFEVPGSDGGFNNPLYGATPGFFTDATDTSIDVETDASKDTDCAKA